MRVVDSIVETSALNLQPLLSDSANRVSLACIVAFWDSHSSFVSLLRFGRVFTGVDRICCLLSTNFIKVLSSHLVELGNIRRSEATMYW